MISFAGIALSSVLLFGTTVGVPHHQVHILPAPSQVVEKQAPEIQGRLKIPKINVDAGLDTVGLTPQGAVDVPKDLKSAAWFDLGPRPGESGNSVIVGHYGWKKGIPAVFNNLHKLEKGDKLYLEDASGVRTTFVVRESRSFDPDAEAPEVFLSSDGKSHLNLITCEGVWNKASKNYSQRLVVFTDKEES